MKLIPTLSIAGALLASAVSADVITTNDGSTINGKVLGIDGGKVTVQTDFAGKITVDQNQVASISTDEPVYLSLDDGTTVLGPVSGQNGSLTVDSSNGTVTTQVEQINESWWPGQKSPTQIEAARNWAYEAAFDLTGKTGNSESTALGASFRATLDGAQDTLEFFAAANFAETETGSGANTVTTKSADDARAGLSYTNKFTEDYNWYVRSEFGYDAVKDIELYYTVAAGFGRILADTDTRKLNIRLGLGYTFESYDDVPIFDTNGNQIGSTPRASDSSATIDFGVNHREIFKWGQLSNTLTYTPAIDDFGNYRIFHDTNLDIPLKAEAWSIRTGITNRYDSEADLSNKEELDTMYYIRMVLKWL